MLSGSPKTRCQRRASKKESDAMRTAKVVSVYTVSLPPVCGARQSKTAAEKRPIQWFQNQTAPPTTPSSLRLAR